MSSGSGGQHAHERLHDSVDVAALMHRALGLDVLACPRCGGRLRLLATISDPAFVEEILGHLGRASRPRPPRAGPPAETAGVIPW